MARRLVHRLGRRGGVLLDVIVGAALILIGAFVLDYLGITFAELVAGAARFFGL